MKKSRIIEVRYRVCLPMDATHEQVEEWVNLFLGQGSMNMDNPLTHFEPMAMEEPILTETSEYAHYTYIEVEDDGIHGGGTHIMMNEGLEPFEGLLPDEHLNQIIKERYDGKVQDQD